MGWLIAAAASLLAIAIVGMMSWQSQQYAAKPAPQALTARKANQCCAGRVSNLYL
jgi:hypothetical protein